MEEDKHYLTQEMYDQLKEELEELKTGKRREIAGRLEFAKSLGDLSENAEYHSARDEQADTEARISELENLLKTSEIVAVRHAPSVGIGSVLTVQKVGTNEEVKLQIVGPEEVDLVAGK